MTHPLFQGLFDHLVEVQKTQDQINEKIDPIIEQIIDLIEVMALGFVRKSDPVPTSWCVVVNKDLVGLREQVEAGFERYGAIRVNDLDLTVHVDESSSVLHSKVVIFPKFWP